MNENINNAFPTNNEQLILTNEHSLEDKSLLLKSNSQKTIKIESNQKQYDEIQVRQVSKSDYIKLKKDLDRVYRKLDRRIIPALWLLYLLTSSVSFCFGMSLTMNSDINHSLVQTLNLKHNDISFASATYFLGYILFDVPMNMIMTKVSPQSWLARIVITVGIVYSCYFFLKNSKSFIILRFVSGVVGAGTWPGLSYYISLWYPNERSTKRIGYYFTAAQISAILSGVISYVFQKMDGYHGFRGWQWMFLIYGLITIPFGISLFFWLPNRPFIVFNDFSKNPLKKYYNKYLKSSYPLNEHESQLHMTDFEYRYKLIKWNFTDILRILLNYKTYLMSLIYFGIIGTGVSISIFGTTIIKTFIPTLTSSQVSFCYSPIWLLDLIGILLITPYADKYKNKRYLVFSLTCCIIIIGMLISSLPKNGWVNYSGLLVLGFGLGPTIPITMSWSSDVFFESHGDIGAAVSIALITGLGNIGSLVASFFLFTGLPNDQERKFRYSFYILIFFIIASIFFSNVTQLCIRNPSKKKSQNQVSI